MTDIIYLTFMGIIAGLLACFWTRIIKDDMILGFIGEWLDDRMWVAVEERPNRVPFFYKLLTCSFCIQVWLYAFMAGFYISNFTPHWHFALVGILGGLGMGNFVVEIVIALRNEDL